MRRSRRLPFVLICGAVACAATAQAAEPRPVLILPTHDVGLVPYGPSDPLAAVLDKASAKDAFDVRSTQVQLTPTAKLRIRVADPMTTPGAGAPVNRMRDEAQDYEVALVREWPGAVSFNTGNFGFDLSPHAAVGVTPYGGLAEAGARLELGKRMDDAARAGLDALGVSDGERFGDKGRWYIFAAASGRAVGLNMLHGEGGWDRAGWTTDQSSTLVGDGQAGIGWRKGSMQTSLGVLHREVKGQHMYFGTRTEPDTVVAFSFAVRPRK